MATFLVRLSDEEMAALRLRADESQRSMNEIVREAIRQAVDHDVREEHVRALTRRIMSEDAALFKRLADS